MRKAAETPRDIAQFDTFADRLTVMKIGAGLVAMASIETARLTIPGFAKVYDQAVAKLFPDKFER